MQRTETLARSATRSVVAFGFMLFMAGSSCFAQADRRGEANAQGQRLFRAGAATSNITPPLGEPIVGGFASPTSTHTHDELHARCLVLDDGQTKLAFAICDNVGIAREVFDAARTMVHR